MPKTTNGETGGMATGNLIDEWQESWTELARKGGVSIKVGRVVVDAFPGIRADVQNRPEVENQARGVEDAKKGRA